MILIIIAHISSSTGISYKSRRISFVFWQHFPHFLQENPKVSSGGYKYRFIGLLYFYYHFQSPFKKKPVRPSVLPVFFFQFTFFQKSNFAHSKAFFHFLIFHTLYAFERNTFLILETTSAPQS